MFQSITKKITFDLVHSKDETNSVLKTIKKKLYKHSLRNTPAFNWSIQQHPNRQASPLEADPFPCNSTIMGKECFGCKALHLCK